MVEVCAINRLACKILASIVWSPAVGSYSPSIDTAVRTTSIGLPLGTLARKSTTGCGSGRKATSSALSSSNSFCFGRRPFHSRKMTSSKQACSASV